MLKRYRIFISYRHSAASVSIIEKLFNSLADFLHFDDIYVDYKAERLGENLNEITYNVLHSDIVLLLIDKDFEVKIAEKKRKRDEGSKDKDFLLEEVKYAVEGQKIVIPVLVDRDDMPSAVNFPGWARRIFRERAVKISKKNFYPDSMSLIERIKRYKARGFVKDHLGLPHDEIQFRIRNAKREVSILITWLNAIEDLAESLRQAGMNGAKIKVLYSNLKIAMERGEILHRGRSYGESGIRATKAMLDWVHNQLAINHLEKNMEYFSYESTPSHILFIIDETVYSAYYRHDEPIKAIDLIYEEIFGSNTSKYKESQEIFSKFWRKVVPVVDSQAELEATTLLRDTLSYIYNPWVDSTLPRD